MVTSYAPDSKESCMELSENKVPQDLMASQFIHDFPLCFCGHVKVNPPFSDTPT